MRRLALVLLVLALAPVPAAFAQSNPFGPLPPAQQETPAPTATPTNIADRNAISQGVLLAIGIGVVALFVAIGVFVTRDARRSLSDDSRRKLERREQEREEAAKRQRETAKTRARAKGRAQKQARRANRPR